jgi:hypothetical protein
MLGLVGFVGMGNPLAGEALVAAALPSAVIVPMFAGCACYWLLDLLIAIRHGKGNDSVLDAKPGDHVER